MSFCAPDGCAEVLYQEYLAPSVRYRFGSGAWSEIIGADDYQITPNYINRVLCDWQYSMGYSVLSYGSLTPTGASNACNGSLATQSRCAKQIVNPQLAFDLSRIIGSCYAPIYKYRVSDYAEADYPCSKAGLNDLSLFCTKPKGYRKVEIYCHKTPSSATPEWVLAWNGTKNYLPGYMLQLPSSGEYPVVYNPSTNIYVGVLPSGSDWEYFNFIPTTNVAPISYRLKITKNGVIVLDQIGSSYPEVQKILSSLSNQTKQISLKKTPYLETIEINQNGIPSNCLNIYKNGNNLSNFAAQICSAANSPPPKYQVICGCQGCESCPPGTCAIQCGDRICCYGGDGVSKKSIALANYCKS